MANGENSNDFLKKIVDDLEKNSLADKNKGHEIKLFNNYEAN